MTQVTWQSRDGRKIEVSISVECSVYTDNRYLDGDLVSSTRVASKSVNLVATLDGKRIGSGSALSTYLTPPAKQAGCTRSLGNLYIMPENVARVEAAIAEETAKAEAAAPAEYHALMAQQIANARARDERARKNMQEIESIERSRAQRGYCTKCHSYCYGDCEA